jgi:hypothetical protein
VSITHFASASQPADNATQAGPGPITITVPGSMTAADLSLVFVGDRVTGDEGTFRNTTTGGQSWHEIAQLPGVAVSAAIYASRFNGTWGANPAFDQASGSTTPLTAIMLAARPSSTSKVMDIDVSPVAGTFVAGTTPFTKTISAITTRNAGAIVYAIWFSQDDNTWSNLTAGWTAVGTFRNATGSQTSAFVAYKVMGAPGTTGSVSVDQATNGGDAGVTCIVSFYERDADFTAVPACDILQDFETSTNGTTLTAAIMNAGAHTNGSIGTWTLTAGVPNLKVSTSGQAGFGLRSVTVNGVSYTDGAGTRGMQQDHANQAAGPGYFSWTPTVAPNVMSMGCWYTPGQAYLDFESYTCIGMQDSGAAGLIAFNAQTFDATFHRINLENADSALIPGPWLTKDTRYWITLQYDFTNAVGQMRVYDTSFNQVGFGCVMSPGAGQQKPNEFRIGSFGGGFPSHPVFSYYDDMLGSLSGTFPLGPAASAVTGAIPPVSQGFPALPIALRY